MPLNFTHRQKTHKDHYRSHTGFHSVSAKDAERATAHTQPSFGRDVSMMGDLATLLNILRFSPYFSLDIQEVDCLKNNNTQVPSKNAA